MRRPLADKRPLGPLFGESGDTIQSRLTDDVRSDMEFEEGGSVKVYFHSSTDMRELKNNEVSLFVTSPPYNVGYNYGSYEDKLGYDEYMTLLAEVFTEAYKKLRPEGKLCINIPAILKGPGKVGENHIAMASDVVQLIDSRRELTGSKFDTPEINKFQNYTDFRLFETIVWNKGRLGTERPLGSLPRPFRFEQEITHESILVFQKPGTRNFSKMSDQRKKASELEKPEYSHTTGSVFDTTLKDSVWNIQPSNPITLDGEKTPVFPMELPRRLIKAYSFVGDIVVDPFAGVGTTMRAAKELDRLSVGYEKRSELKPKIKELVGEKI